METELKDQTLKGADGDFGTSPTVSPRSEPNDSPVSAEAESDRSPAELTPSASQIHYVTDKKHKIVILREVTQFDLFKKDDLMEVVYQSEEYYVGRHLDKETEHTFPAVQCDVLNPIPFEVREHSDEKKEMLKKPVSELKQKVEAAKQIRARSPLANLRPEDLLALYQQMMQARGGSQDDETQKNNALTGSTLTQASTKDTIGTYGSAFERSTGSAWDSSRGSSYGRYPDPYANGNYGIYGSQGKNAGGQKGFSPAGVKPPGLYADHGDGVESQGLGQENKLHGVAQYVAEGDSAAMFGSNGTFGTTSSSAAQFSQWPSMSQDISASCLYDSRDQQPLQTDYDAQQHSLHHPDEGAAHLQAALMDALQKNGGQANAAGNLYEKLDNNANAAGALAANGWTEQKNWVDEMSRFRKAMLYLDGKVASPHSLSEFGVPHPPSIVDRGSKFLCTFIVGVPDSEGFRVSRKIIGLYGKHMKNISAIIPGAKVRLRGRGSGFAERETGREAEEELQVNVSVPTWEGYVVCKHVVGCLLERIYQEYEQKSGHRVQLRIMEHPRNPKPYSIPAAKVELFLQNPIFRFANAHEFCTVSDMNRDGILRM